MQTLIKFWPAYCLPSFLVTMSCLCFRSYFRNTLRVDFKPLADVYNAILDPYIDMID